MKENPRCKFLLASKSPRRKELLSSLGCPIELVNLDADEIINEPVDAVYVAEYLSLVKTQCFDVGQLKEGEVLVTADTVVINWGRVLGKPKDLDEARTMLHELSGHAHQVMTGVCLTTTKGQIHFSESTLVWFKELTDDEIDYYLAHYEVLDKAGAYGVQDWIGMIGVTKLQGCYYNVMGLPVARLWTELDKVL